MSTTTPPPKKVNRSDSSPELPRRQDHAVRRLRPQRHLRAPHRSFYELGVEPWRVAKFSGIGCSSKSPAYFLASRTASTPCTAAPPRWPPARCWPTATCWHGRHRRRRHRLHRHRPVHPHAAPQRADDLHHREQRRLRPHQGAVLGHRRPRLHAQDRRRERVCRPSTAACWASNWAPRSWPALSPATSGSYRPS
jgi:hypothetical protein